MTESPSPVVPGNVPRVLSKGRYVALIAGVCVVMSVLGAAGKNLGREYAGADNWWVGWGLSYLVLLGVCAALARYVGNPTTPILCGVFVGLGAAHGGEDFGRTFGSVWAQVGWFLAFFAAYFVWVFAVHKRIAAAGRG